MNEEEARQQYQRYAAQYATPDPTIEPTRALREIRARIKERVTAWSIEPADATLRPANQRARCQEAEECLMIVDDMIEKEIESARHPERNSAFYRSLVNR